MLESAGDVVRRQAARMAPARWRLVGWRRILRRIRELETACRRLDEQQLAAAGMALRRRAVLGREPLSHLLPEAYALAAECMFRRIGVRLYDVQLLGAIALHHGCVAEMQTGEGKTLTATLPVYLNALSNGGVHVVTANDYLARRDAEWMQPVYQMLGLSVGYIQGQMPRPIRRKAYGCTITYGAAREFGFDFLRDRLMQRRLSARQLDGRAAFPGDAAPDGHGTPVQRAARFALVDEADSVLIDEAQTPLIVSGPCEGDGELASACFRWCARIGPRFSEGAHYQYADNTRTVYLTPAGLRLVQSLPKPDMLARLTVDDLSPAVERAIQVGRNFIRDRHYVVRRGQVVIVDEFTGRLGQGRRWRNGIHQAIEAKEGLRITTETLRQAEITMPELFARYPRLAGMTGTASSARREFRTLYGLPVVVIPTNRPCRRRQLPPKIFLTEADKLAAIVREVREMKHRGRPVLIGTRTVERSERVSELLAEAGIQHDVLNAKQDAEEARIVAQAGQRGRVTVATNMAGRGTDIRLGDGVANLGGLHVICTELHESERIDRQLAGRCARQGDPGSFRQLLSLEDDILATGLGRVRAERTRKRARRQSHAPDRLQKTLRAAQRRTEHARRRSRKMLVHARQTRKRQIDQLGLDAHLDLFL